MILQLFQWGGPIQETRHRMAGKDMVEDVAMDILVRLPVKSLVRFKSLSKFYYAVITNPNFIKKHFHYSTENRLRLLAFHDKGKFSSKPCITLLSNEMSQTPTAFWLPPPGMLQPPVDFCQQSPETSEPPINSGVPFPEGSKPVPEISQAPIDLGLPFPSRSLPPINLELPFYDKNVSSIVAYGPCNGIFCLYGTYINSLSQLIFWNPATREVKVLPLPHHPPSDREICMHGFGIDSKTNDYKVVSILTALEKPIDFMRMSASLITKVEVYNLSTNSWKMINANVSAFDLVAPVFSSYLNGMYHWLSTRPDDEVIHCFDMSNEVFLKMKFPLVVESYTNEYCMFANVTVINGSIAYVKEYSCFGNMSKSRIVIWEMKEYGVEETWAKQFNIVPHPGWLYFRGFWNDDEILVAGMGSGPLFSCKLDTQRPVQEFPVQVGPRLFQSFRFVESMFPISVLAVE